MSKENEWGDMVQLRMAAESVADAINVRTRIHNRIRSGSANSFLMIPRDPEDSSSPMDLVAIEGQPTESQIAKSVEGHAVLKFEKEMRSNLQRQYEMSVPLKIREWASGIPILKSGELFPRIVGLTGNPRHAIPLKMEGEGKDRKAVPDGDPYDRSLRQLWQWCGRGNPDLTVTKGDQASLLARGKITTVSPLLYTFSTQLVKGSGRSEDVQDSDLFKIYTEETRRMRGHDGKCETGTWPRPCAVTHNKHYKVCRNHKIPPMKPDGCGVSAHPEWGEIGSPWRPGHINAHGHRIVQKEFLRQFWIVAEDTDW
jgi:hypothetical protein